MARISPLSCGEALHRRLSCSERITEKLSAKILTRVSEVRSTPIRGPRNSRHEFAPRFVGVSEDAYAKQGDDGDDTPPVHDAVVVRILSPGSSRVHPGPSADNCDRKLLPSLAPSRCGRGQAPMTCQAPQPRRHPSAARKQAQEAPCASRRTLDAAGALSRPSR